jgi:hypothetical protein
MEISNAEKTAVYPFQSAHLQIFQWIEDDTRFIGEWAPQMTQNVFTSISKFHRGDSPSEYELALSTRVNIPAAGSDFPIPSVDKICKLQSFSDYVVELSIISEPVIKLTVNNTENYILPWDKSEKVLRSAVSSMTKGLLPILRIFKDHVRNTHTAAATVTENGFVLVVSSSFAYMVKKHVSIACSDGAFNLFDITIDGKKSTVSMADMQPVIDNYLDILPSFVKRFSTLDQRASELLAKLVEHHV